ncbi:kinesin heavy chain [Rhizopus delemar RA 99-880]|uniref:Kinesin-like protein n=1 Tax=Rhizopus delemar (strain RA 99-880 / ATCC MYA-4621 / FGSC 9543 / NRRL 43880) TaxID=246409 RepID=I1CBD9_RHIO9|nr:kinesin heavy chain [Rhizopus delemar RA 99-880]|eukprot:EIE85769.1 kinesin heavy chain [Rhizopus delemar RA 99-880]
MSNNIKVVCRFRPQNALEIREGGVPIIDIDVEGTQIALKGKDFQGSFSFDKVFGMKTPQKDVFEYSIKTIVDDVTAGYNGTVFAYGQTGSGKTFTMMGADIDDENTKGIIPRIVEQIFTSIMAAPTSQDNLPIHEDKTHGVYVKGLLEVYVGSQDDVYEVMRNGSANRVVSATNMNAESSRSHSIVVVTITQKNIDTGAAKSGKLYLVDLAGSEKSSHIPYRDSKLTRILQESLGGNSRTTLIINCSPSSYNEAETLSTLRFGMRAKTIKNKAKVNADLSPTELKALLKKVKTETITFKTYIAALEGEVGIWRSGQVVPEDKWVTMDKVTRGDFNALPPASGFKSPLPSDDFSRPVTPAIVLEKDERDEFLRRENELMDQITEKETELANREKFLESLKEEMNYYKEQEKATAEENQTMTSELSQLRLLLQKVSFESKENAITVDSLREANQELISELEELKKSLVEIKNAQNKASQSNKEKKKAEKVAEIMSGFDVSNEISEKERQIRDAIIRLELDGNDLTVDELVSLKRDLFDSRVLVEQHTKIIDNLIQEKQAIEQKKLEFEAKFANLEREYEEFLDRTIAEEEFQIQKSIDVDETLGTLKAKLEHQFVAKKEIQQREIDRLRLELEHITSEHSKLSMTINELKAANNQLQTLLSEQAQQRPTDISKKEKDLERMRKVMAQQLAEFEMTKKALMRDLQLRCEKVVELELSLDETREQYNNVLKASSNKRQQKNMAFLVRDLEHLCNVQKQLVEQNDTLKKEVALADRKLIAKNERIQNLETLLGDAQEKLLHQNQKFEAQLQAVRERLGQARIQKSNQPALQLLNISRIAKPLRGGGIVIENSNVNNNNDTEKHNNMKHNSWMSNFIGAPLA